MFKIILFLALASLTTLDHLFLNQFITEHRNTFSLTKKKTSRDNVSVSFTHINSRLDTRLVSQKSWVRYPVWQHTFVSPSADSRGTVVSYWRKYVHEVLVNRLGGLSLPWKSVVRLTDRPDMTLDVYRVRKTTIQQQQQQPT